MILHILCKQNKIIVFTKYIDIYIDVKTPTCRQRYGTCECIHINICIKYNKKKYPDFYWNFFIETVTIN